MIGVFDSGVGGMTAVQNLRALAPNCDLIFFPDKENAPYGIKTESELIRLSEQNIERLIARGADSILIACCTASTVHRFLKEEYRSLSTPIIAPTARAAANATKNGRIGVIATEATVRSGEFTRQLSSLGINVTVELPSQPLVAMIERGARDGRLSKAEQEWLSCHLSKLREHEIDTLILGCTHFPHLTAEISANLPGIKIISSSFEGAVEKLKNSRINLNENGKTIYICRKRNRKERKTKWEDTEEAESTTQLPKSLQ